MKQNEKEEEWTDITHIFIQGALQLSNNDILLAPHLSLLDIVSAIEIMDPRMDSGVGRTIQEHVLQFNPLQPLTPSQVATIIDLSLACEVTWYTGRLLSQTVLTSSYLHHLDTLKSHPDPLVKLVLRAYLLALTKSCAIISDEISQENLRQNEDVNSEQQIVDIYHDIDVTQTLEELDEAYSVLKCWPNELDDYRIPLMERIRFRIEFLYSLALLSSSPTVLMVSSLEAHLHSAREAIQSIRLHPTYPATSSISFTAQNSSVRSAFNPNFHQTVTSHSPPRPVHFPDTFHHLVAMVQRILEELSLVYQIALGNSFSDWLSFFHAFSRRDPIAFPFVRSYLMSIFQNENVIALNPNQTLSWLGRECLSDLSAGQICYPSNPSNTNRYLLDRLSGFLVNYFSAFAANRPRGRRILSNSLSEWKALYNATWINRLDLPDSTLQGLQILIYYFSIESGLQVSLMGFDLELYELNNDRLAMWWVIERLSERAWLLLNELSQGAESLDGRLLRILGKLARVAAQLTRRKHQQSGRPLSELRLRRAVFERRIRPLIARDASFDDSSLVVSQLALPRPLLDYHTMVSSFLSTPPLLPQDLHHILADVMEQLGQVSALARRQKRVGLSQFHAYIDCLTRATEKLIATNQAGLRWLEGVTKAEDECTLSLESLKISSLSSPGPVQYDLGGDDPDHAPLQRPVPHLGQESQDVAARWFLVN